MLAIHSETSRAYCLVVILLPEPRRPVNMNSPGFLAARSHVIVDRLTGLFCQLEPDRLPRLFLSDRGPIDCISTRSDIVDLEGDNIAATQLAIDSQPDACP
jgi:hypothetical protein